MTGSNLPPGVTESMIPGNRPEDELEDAFADALTAKAAEHGLTLPDDPDSWMWTLARLARDLGYEQGFGEGRDDERMAQGAEAMEALAEPPVKRVRDWCEQCEDTPAGQRWLCPNAANHQPLEEQA